MCTIGLSETRPSILAVGSPKRDGHPGVRRLVHADGEQQNTMIWKNNVDGSLRCIAVCFRY